MKKKIHHQQYTREKYKKEEATTHCLSHYIDGVRPVYALSVYCCHIIIYIYGGKSNCMLCVCAYDSKMNDTIRYDDVLFLFI